LSAATAIFKPDASPAINPRYQNFLNVFFRKRSTDLTSLRTTNVYLSVQKSTIALAVTWTEKAASSSKASVAFGKNTWEKMHGGRTSAAPHCRPEGFFNPRTKGWYVRLWVAPDLQKPDTKEKMLEWLLVKEGDTPPTKDETYSVILEALENIK
jgi:hypothetical protein